MEREIRELNQEIREMIREMNREMKREMQELKADVQEMKAYMKRLSRSASADLNINARCSLDHQFKKSDERKLQLVFANQLPDRIFTRDKIRDERGDFIQIKLIDTISPREIVQLDPLSIVIEIVVLDGDFGSEGNENWTEQEFNAKIVQQRKTGPLLKGKQNITLRKGVGIIDDLSFLDNSSWNACGKFRLGARVLQRSSIGQARIKEAISQAFAVRDYRGKRSQKLDLPSLDNDVSPLKKIKKNAKCHTDNNTHTVRDFKQMHRTDLNKQIEILKDCSDSDWEVTVQDASCVVDDENSILSQTTDPPLHYELTAPYQGSVEMQNYRNHASSSHHKGGLSTAKEIVPNLASQPLSTSTGYPVNAQGVQSISNLHPPTNGVSGQNSSQSNEHGIHCSPNYNPFMTESSQINNGPHPHFPAALHASNAFEDMRRNADSNPLQSKWEAGTFNNPTTGSLLHEFPVPHQEADSNPLIIPEAETYNSPATGALPLQYTVPNQGLAGMQKDCNPASLSQYMSALLQEDVPNDVYSNPEWNPSQLSEISNFPPSPNSYITTEYSQNNNGLLEPRKHGHAKNGCEQVSDTDTCGTQVGHARIRVRQTISRFR